MKDDLEFDISVWPIHTEVCLGTEKHGETNRID